MIREAAKAYIADGWAVVPLLKGEKGTREAGWLKKGQAGGYAPEDFKDDANLGVVPGPASRDRVDVDLDAVEAIAAGAMLLPPTALIHGRESKPQSHHWYRVPGAKAKQFKDPITKAMLLEVRSDNGQTVLPPSTHPSGEIVRWDCEGEPASLTPEVLKAAATEVAIAAILARYYPGKGGRHALALITTGFLVRYLPADRVLAVMKAVFKITEDEEFEMRVRAVTDTLDRAKDPANKTTGMPSFKAEFPHGTEIADAIMEWLGVSADDAADLKARLKIKERAMREVRRELDREDRPPVEIPTPMTLAERLALPVSEIEWRIEGLQPAQARVILSAQFKAGKTTLVQNLIRSIVDGDAFLGFPVTPIAGSVVLIDVEMSPRQLDAWFRDQKIRHADRIVVFPLRGAAASLDVRDVEMRAQWVARLRDARCQFVILDCLRPVMDALGLNEHNEAGLLLTAIDALLSEAEVPEALIVHHAGHNGERARGDSRLRDWPDVEWRLVREDEDPASDRFFTAFGRDVDLAESKVAYDLETRRMWLEGGSRRDSKAHDAIPEIVRVIEEAKEPLSAHKIERALADSDHSRQAVRRAIKLALKSGEVSRDLGGQGGGARYSKGEVPSVPF